MKIPSAEIALTGIVYRWTDVHVPRTKIALKSLPTDDLITVG